MDFSNELCDAETRARRTKWLLRRELPVVIRKEANSCKHIFNDVVAGSSKVI
jgi:hypothetical protein